MFSKHRHVREPFGYYGMYRARVVEVPSNLKDDGAKHGAVRVFVPDIFSMEGFSEVKENESLREKYHGIIAFPANNYVGSYNSEKADEANFQCSFNIPAKGSWVWVFFEAGDIHRAYYLTGVFNRDSELPPEMSKAVNPEKVHILIKTREGRSFIVSDSPEDPKVVISGKRRNLDGPPHGNLEGADEMGDLNTTFIMINEIPGRESVLIRTYKGDSIYVDVENRTLDIDFFNDITLYSRNGRINLVAKGDVNIITEQNLTVKASNSVTTESNRAAIRTKNETNITSDNVVIIDPKTPMSNVDNVLITNCMLSSCIIDPSCTVLTPCPCHCGPAGAGKYNPEEGKVVYKQEGYQSELQPPDVVLA